MTELKGVSGLELWRSTLAGPGRTGLSGATASGVMIAPVAMVTVQKWLLNLHGILKENGTTCLARTGLTYLLSVKLLLITKEWRISQTKTVELCWSDKSRFYHTVSCKCEVCVDNSLSDLLHWLFSGLGIMVLTMWNKINENNEKLLLLYLEKWERCRLILGEGGEGGRKMIFLQQHSFFIRYLFVL